MILVEQVAVQNFMNYGQAETVLRIDTHRNCIITGKNGQGKSSILLDSLCYSFYGKGYRSVKASQLINSINGKKMLVKTNFTKGSDSYQVSRGQKPSIFEIYKNGNLVDEKALVGSYQEYLEEILGMNFMTFKQIVVIGSANYIPFMRLSTPQRREIVETMLPVSIYAESGKIARERLSESKSKLVTVDSKIESTKSALLKTKGLLTAVQADNSSVSEKLNSEIDRIQSEILDLETSRSRLSEEFNVDSLKTIEEQIRTLKEAETKATKLISFTNGSLNKDQKDREFYSQDSCPTCLQHITEETRVSMYSKIDDKIANYTKNIDELNSALSTLQLKISKLSLDFDKQKGISEEIRDIDYQISSKNSTIQNLLQQIQRTKSQVSEESLLSTVKEGMATLDSLMEEKSKILSKIDVQQYVIEMFKDSGIKALIVGEFIPLMNQKINEYLEKFDLFVDFSLDSEFNETIKSRHRDAFSYNSFSEGEKQRIDLAILFAWRSIAMERNSAATNIIIFDETLDQSLDADAVDGFTEILEDIGNDIHVFVVSHKDMVPEVFDRWIKVEKKNDFAVLTET